MNQANQQHEADEPLIRKGKMFSEEFPSVSDARPKNILCCSGGNDSVALIQWAYENELSNVTVLFNDTGWAVDWWADRMVDILRVCRKYKFKFSMTDSMGFKDLVRMKKAFPMAASKMSFCSEYLKKKPTREWLKKYDPFHTATIYVGIRRCESQNRSNHPRSIIHDSEYKRPMEFPLVNFSDMDRDLMQEKTGIDILLHGSLECFPCVNSKRSDFRLLAKYPDRIDEVEELEKEIAVMAKNGKERYMFRKYRHMGASGIREVVKWGLCDQGKYKAIAGPAR